MRKHVLIVAGDAATRAAVARVLQPAGYSVELAAGEKRARELVAAGGIDAAVVAPASLAKMPVVNGLDLSAYPDGPLSPVDLKENPATCWWWQKTAGEERARNVGDEAPRRLVRSIGKEDACPGGLYLHWGADRLD